MSNIGLEVSPTRSSNSALLIGAALGASLLAAGGTAYLARTAADPASGPRVFPALRSFLTAAKAADGGSGVAPFVLHAANTAEAERAVQCLTNAIYYEAASEPLDGQRAVAQVVVNRVRDRHFPKSVCGVVYEGWERRTGCQFSFVCDGSIRRRPASADALDRVRPVAEAALGGYVDTAVGAATHYHAEYVLPYWRSSVAKITEIGRHIFYSWKGRAGLASALTMPYGGGEFQVAEAALRGLQPQAKTPPQQRSCHRDRGCGRELRLARTEHGGRVHGHMKFTLVHVRYG